MKGRIIEGSWELAPLTLALRACPSPRSRGEGAAKLPVLRYVPVFVVVVVLVVPVVVVPVVPVPVRLVSVVPVPVPVMAVPLVEL
jgi:hypothetical protein